MLEFLDNCLSFPVNIFSALLIISAIYWLVAALGLLDIESFDLDMDSGGGDIGGDLGGDVGGDIGGDMGGDLGDAGGDIGDGGGDLGGEAGEAGPEIGTGAAGSLGLFSSLLFYLGLYGVPLTMIVTFIAVFGWLMAYYSFHWVLGALLPPGLIRYALGLLLFLIILLVAALMTSVAIKPFRPLFRKERQVTNASLRGRVVLVRSSQVTDSYGEATCNEGGSGMLLDVRPANPGQVFNRGDKAVILNYDPERRLYTIISEDEFKGH